MALTDLGVRPNRIVRAGDGPGVIVNRDLTNSVFIGPDPSILGGNPNSVSILDALVAIPVSGESDVWACTAGPTVQVDFIQQGAQSWSPSPAQTAQQIATLGLMKDTTGQTINGTLGTPAQDGSVTGLKGVNNQTLSDVSGNVFNQTQGGRTIGADVYASKVPFAVSSTLLGHATGVSVPVSGSPLFGPFSIDQPGYEVWVSVAETGTGGSGANCQIDLNWTDSAIGQQIWTDTVYIVPGTFGNPHQVLLYGRARANQFTLQIANGDTVGFNVSYAVAASSKFYEELDFRTLSMPVPSAGYTLPDFMDSPDLILAQSTITSLAAGAGKKIILPLFVGEVAFHFESASNATDGEIQVFPVSDSTSVPLYDKFTDSTGNLNDRMFLPASQCQVNVVNHNASARTLRVSFTGNPT